ncbi:TetR/AcrR family transcriptional regulator [Pseudonocardia sp. TRM90224]|uniref:TetR/AcrR family transcriptional regulator n=1 Tax=Pseudonocardia sp. TRM90224 TaxID=2812678 RepID=UPI001E625998|nr:TetR/AcrR family transcriptional regulator [Pseudonocardia sp. TRM90224]
MDTTSGTGLPASIEIAWGLREKPTKGPKRGLSIDRIVEAAVHVAATDGLGAVAMGRVASELGVGTMSLYRYVGAKDELYILMSEAVFATGPPDVSGLGWREGLATWARSLFDVLFAHPWVLRMPVSGPPATPNQLRWMESGLIALRGSGLGEGEKISVMLLVMGFVRSEVTVSSELTTASAAQGITEQEAAQAYGRLMTTLVTPERFPAVAAAFAAGVASEEDGPEIRFSWGLERVLDGVAALVADRHEPDS